eukprot:2738723-Rhodomonas_salina.3
MALPGWSTPFELNVVDWQMCSHYQRDYLVRSELSAPRCKILCASQHASVAVLGLTRGCGACRWRSTPKEPSSATPPSLYCATWQLVSWSTCLHTCYGMSGTHRAYCATRSAFRGPRSRLSRPKDPSRPRYPPMRGLWDAQFLGEEVLLDNTVEVFPNIRVPSGCKELSDFVAFIDELPGTRRHLPPSALWPLRS